LNSIKNFYASVLAETDQEVCETVLDHDHFRLERIVSDGHATPEGQWFDQAQDEWVLLLKGSAGLRMEGDAEPIPLGAGDYLLIPAHRKHRVEWTSRTESTFWLALHYHDLSTPESAGSGRNGRDFTDAGSDPV
jgi:cupin 2 domain-containing protein